MEILSRKILYSEKDEIQFCFELSIIYAVLLYILVKQVFNFLQMPF